MPERKDQPDELTTQQTEAAMLYMARKSNGMTAEQVADAVGVSRRTLYRWTTLPKWKEFVKDKTREIAEEHVGEVLDILLRNCRQGNNKAIEIFLKVTGYLGNDAVKLNVTNNVNGEERSDAAITDEIEELKRMLAEQDEEDRLN